MVLLIGAGLMLRSLLELQSVNPGFDSQRVLTMTLDLNWSRYTSNDLILGFHDRLNARLTGQPGVVSTASTLTFPLDGHRRFHRAGGRLEHPEDGVADLLDHAALEAAHQRVHDLAQALEHGSVLLVALGARPLGVAGEIREHHGDGVGLHDPSRSRRPSRAHAADGTTLRRTRGKTTFPPRIDSPRARG